MTTLSELCRQRFTDEYVDLRVDDLPQDATLVFASQSTEERGRHGVWDAALQTRPQDCIQVSPESGGPGHEYEALASRNGVASSVSLRDDRSLTELLRGGASLVLDISGLTHQTWASILRALVKGDPGRLLRVMYVEPSRYRSHDTPATLGSFDLTVRFEGVRPIPGYVRLARRSESTRRVIVPLLGFEGSRPRLVHAELDASRAVPVIGLPGFRMEFPAVAVACNQGYLEDFGAYHKLRFARGSCPFDIYRVLSEIAVDEDSDHLQIAPLGTKPHALGAFLYRLHHADTSEIVYDHPVRRPSRTEGIGLTHMYRLSEFIGAGAHGP